MSAPDHPVDEQCRRGFEAERLGGGDRPLEDFLPDEGDATYLGTLEELVCIDLELRWKRLDSDASEAVPPPSVADYADRFPQLREGELARRLRHEADWLRTRFAPSRRDAGDERYELREIVGRGAFADVWRAWDSELRRDVAIKVPRPEVAERSDALERAVREARSAARLHHPFIVSVHEIVEREGRPCIVSEFVDGPTLAAALGDRRFECDEGAKLIAQVADALAYAHECGVVHRDVKPGNLLLAPDGRLLLTDFGLARLQSDATLTQQGDLIGTPAYMAPEQARGDSADARSDVYSLGVVLYQILTGRPPFEAPSTAALLHAVLHRDPDELSTGTRRIPPDLETICLTAMAKEPPRRYQSAGELAADLRRYLERRPIAARRLGALGRLRLWARRNPLVSTTLAVSAVVIGVVALVAFERVLDARDTARSHQYQARVGEAESRIAARQTGWLSRARRSVAEAASLDVPERDVPTLRALVARTEGAQHPSFEDLGHWSPQGGTVIALAVAPHVSRVFAVTDESVLWSREIPDGEVIARFSLDATPTALACDPQSRALVVATRDGRLRRHDTDTLAQTGLGRDVESWVSDLAFSPDGSLLAAALEAGPVALFSFRSPTRLERLPDLAGHEGGTTCLAFSPDGSQLLTAGEEPALRLWDLAEGELVRAFPSRIRVTRVAIARDGRSAALGTPAALGFRRLDLMSGAVRVPVEPNHSRAVSFLHPSWNDECVTASHDGTLAAWRGERRQAVADGDSGPIVAAVRLPIGSFAPHPIRSYLLAYRDGSLQAWGLERPRARDQWTSNHAATFVPGSTRLVLTHEVAIDYASNSAPVSRAFWTPGIVGFVRHPSQSPQDLVAVRSDGATIPVRGHGSGEARSDLRVPRCQDLIASSPGPDARSISVVTDDGRVLVLSNGAKHEVLSDVGDVHAVVPLADERSLLVACDRGLAVCRTGADAEWADRTGAVRALDLGGDRIAAGLEDGCISLRRRASPGVEERRLDAHEHPVVALDLSADESRLVSVDAEGGVLLWDLTDAGGPVQIANDAHPVWAGFDPSGRWLTLGSSSGAFLVDVDERATVLYLMATNSCTFDWTSDGGALLVGTTRGNVWRWTLPEISAAIETARRRGVRGVLEPVEALLTGGMSTQNWGIAASPDGRRIVTTGHGGKVQLWDAETLHVGQTLQTAGLTAWTAAFSPGGGTVAAGTGGDVVLWDTDTGVERLRIEISDTLVVGVAFHPSRPLLATATLGGDVRLWDTATGKLETELLPAGGPPVHGIAFRPTGETLAAARDDAAVIVWPLSAERSLPHEVRAGGHPVWAVAWSPDGDLLASADESGDVILRDAVTLELVLRLSHEDARLRSLSFDDSGRYLAVSAYSESGSTWDLERVRDALRLLGLDW